MKEEESKRKKRERRRHLTKHEIFDRSRRLICNTWFERSLRSSPIPPAPNTTAGQGGFYLVSPAMLPFVPSCYRTKSQYQVSESYVDIAFFFLLLSFFGGGACGLARLLACVCATGFFFEELSDYLLHYNRLSKSGVLMRCETASLLKFCEANEFAFAYRSRCIYVYLPDRYAFINL